MDVIDAVYARRAIKHFDPQHRMSTDDEQLLLSAALCSPTAFNIQNWRLVIPRDTVLRQAVRSLRGTRAKSDASLVIALCADLNAWAREPQRYWHNAPQAVQKMMIPAMKQYYEAKPAVQRDEACVRAVSWRRR